MKHYRFAALIASTSFVFFWAFWILNFRTSHYDLWQVAILILSIYGNITWFVGIHTDSAEGLQTSYLAELELEGEHQYMQKILPVILCLILVNEKNFTTSSKQDSRRRKLLIQLSIYYFL